jgi:protein-disulfide isomerase
VETLSEPAASVPRPGRRIGGTTLLLATAALVLAVAVVWWMRHEPANGQAPARPPAGAQASAAALLLAQRTMGDSAAPVTIYEFSDFQCPFCRVFWDETMPLVEREYVRAGKARLVFVNFPIEGLHPNANAAHVFAMCAAAQNVFWRYHDLLFRHQQAWSSLDDPAPFFRALADSARLDQRALTGCLNAGAVEQIIAADLRSGDEFGINSTPSFLVGRMLIRGTIPMTTFRTVLDSIYQAAAR